MRDASALIAIVDQVGGVATVTVRGEFEPSSCSGLRDRLLSVAETCPQRLVLDLGISDQFTEQLITLIAAARRQLPVDCLMEVRSASPAVRNLFKLAGLPGVQVTAARQEAEPARLGDQGQEAEPSRRVLIADDHAPTRDDVRRVLGRDERFEICAEAADAAEAVQAALRKRPDICLLDLSMPGGGLAAVWEIASRLPESNIVILTVSDNDASLFAALEAGARGYLLKTMNLNRLPDALDGVSHGEAAMQRALVARVLERFRRREPRWRQAVGEGGSRWRLTSREWEVLDLLAQGLSTAEIAERLVLSSSAVRVHVASIVRKLGVPDRAAAVELFRRRQVT